MFSRQWEAARDEARDLDKYPPDWDGAGADPVPLPLIREVLRLFRDLENQRFTAPDLVYPLADGSVMAEWHHPGGVVQAVNVRGPGRVHVVTVGADGGRLDGPAGEGPDPAVPHDPPPADGDAFEFSLAA
jgi:hypothetical protein